MLSTQIVKDAVIVAGVVILIVAYNRSPYWTRKFTWFPKTRTGQILWVLVAFSFLLVYALAVG